jgi:hypothetical protein
MKLNINLVLFNLNNAKLFMKLNKFIQINLF